MSGQDQKSSLKILFHIGANKTGSTALQNMLYNNRHMLYKYGICYKDSGFYKSGLQSINGGKLYQLLKSGASHIEINREITKLIEPDHLSIISNEQLSLLKEAGWQKLFESLRELGANFQIIAYVRSPLGYYISRYQQQVKKGRFSGNLDEFIDDHQWNHLNMLQNLLKFGNNLNLKVIPYDQHSAKLFGTFWDYVFTTFGIDIRGLIPEDHFLTNRGISMEEINMLCSIKRNHGMKTSSIISNFLVNEVEKNGTELTYSSLQIQKITNRHQEHVRWVNDTFLEPDNVIQNNVEDYTIVDVDQTDDYPDSSTTMKVIHFLLRRLNALGEEQSEK